MPVSMMWAWKVKRSTTAAARRGSVKVGPHSLKGWCWRRGDRGAFFSFGENLEQQFGAAGVDADIAELVNRSRSSRP